MSENTIATVITPLSSSIKKIESDKLNEESVHQDKKQKSFLSWINRFNNNSNNHNSKEENKNCDNTTKLSLNSNNSNNSEYVGVQGLKEFWNSKITLGAKSKNQINKKSATLESTHRKYCSYESNLNSSKSVSCLLNDRSISFDISHQDKEKENSDQEEENLCTIKEKRRPQSDNFYKYKTASTKKRLSLSGLTSTTITKDDFLLNQHQLQSNCIDNSSLGTVRVQKVYAIGTNFPLIASTPTGEKIHWAKREDILVNRKNIQQSKSSLKISAEPDQFMTTAIDLGFSHDNNHLCISEDPKATISSECNEVLNSTLEMAVKSSNNIKDVSETTIPPITKTKNKETSNDKTDIGSFKSQNGSTNSLSVGSDSPVRKRNPTTRKYSFKTHAKTSYIGTPRKMANHSKVAALTNKFNQMVQKDVGILEEIKKKNGVLMSRAGHVYKVKEETDNGKRKIKKDLKSNEEDDVSLRNIKRRSSVKRSSSVCKVQNTNSQNSKDNGTVKATVEKFERQESKCNHNDTKPKLQKLKSTEKPKVPLKSEQVLQRTREIAIRNSQKKLKMTMENGSKLASKIEIQTNILEEIVEETKTNFEDTTKSEAELNLQKLEKTDENNVLEETSANQPVKDNQIKSISSSSDVKKEESITKEINDENDQELLQKKNKYSRLYERFRFKSPFTKKYNINDDLLVKIDEKDIQQNQSEQNVMNVPINSNKKLENLSKSTNDLCIQQYVMDKNKLYEELKSKMKPNDSFLFRGNSRIGLISNDNNDTAEILIEAVNSRLVNKTQSMDNMNFSNFSQFKQISPEIRDYPNIIQKPVEVLQAFKESSKCNDEQNEENNNKKEDFDDLYEPISIKDCHAITTDKDLKIPTQSSFLYRSFNNKKNNDNVPAVETTNDVFDENNIYQTLLEAKGDSKLENRNSIASYESVETYEHVPENDDKTNDDKSSLQDGYDICDPPEPPPPRKSEGDVRNTSDELPPIPKPINIFDGVNNNNYHHHLYHYNTLPEISNTGKSSSTTTHSEVVTIINSISTRHREDIDDEDNDEHCYDDENIYDTIKGSETSHCYESLNEKFIHHSHQHHHHNSTSSEITSISNCYESIGSLRRNMVLCHSDSISTLSSDQKTNSLYGITLGQQRLSLQDGSSDDNSDEWIDISDENEDDDENGHKKNKQQFIVVRERTKCHRSPDWSKRVRDQRVQKQQHITSYIDDDSDHYYEPLYTKDNNTNENSMSATTTNTLNNNETTIISGTEHNNIYHAHHQQHTTLLQANNGDNSFSDDYDSFDTDDESDEEEVKKNDSGVDISNKKLPEPPPATNQVYAFVRKVKNFISNKKPPRLANYNHQENNSSMKMTTPTASRSYENTQFYLGTSPEYQNVTATTPHDRDKRNKSRQKMISTTVGSKSKSKCEDLYENSDFHTLAIPTTSPSTSPLTPTSTNNNATSHQIKSVENNISSPLTPTTASTRMESKTEHSTNAINNSSEIITRKKSKGGKSFKSKLRKSLGSVESGFSIGSSTLNTTRSTFYISDSVDVDSGIFEKNPSSDTNLSPAPSTEQCENQKNNNLTVTTRKTKKNSNSPELNKRRTTLGIRPNNPPPPPPVDKKLQKKRTPTTSWYAECGVFKANNHSDELGRGERSSSTSWYAEAGLYQTSGASVASSSGSSGVSTGGEGGPGDDKSHSMFSNEPLYQIYSAAKLESISRDMEEQDSADGYEEIGKIDKLEEEQKKTSRPSALQLVGPKQGPSRTLWSEIPEVINSGILSTLTPTERRLQEAKFEILTSEASYLKSLNLLKAHFMNHPAFRDTSILSSSDRKTLFSSVLPVNECSDRLLCDLEKCWQDNIMLLGLCKSLYKHAEHDFHVYVAFCEHQGKLDRTLRRLKDTNSIFSETLDMLEAHPVCCGLNLHSFLMLPMQRITRLPLLIDAVFSKIKQDDNEYEDWKITLAILNKIVSQCNDAANRCEQAYEIEKISRQIEFPSNIRSLAIAPVGILAPGKKPRTLVKKGELIHLIWRGDDAKLTFGKKFIKSQIFIFLFTDLLVLTKKKNDDQYTVFDYCPRSMITVSSGDAIPQLPTKEITQAGKNLFLLTLLENHEGKTIEMILSCPSISEQQRWLQAFSPPESDNPDEKLYEQWDCPQVVAKHEYTATEPDLLSLEPGDVINVTRKMADGWYEGERIRDGASGWFPGSFTEEVNSPHVRARNLKQRYRLSTFAGSYLETCNKKKN